MTDFGFDHGRWNSLHNDQLDIEARDPDGHVIGTARAEGKWQPVEGSKRVLVGEFDHYNFYNPVFSGDEADFNIYITPDPPFRYLLDDVVAKMSADEREELERRKRGPGYCIDCEITPDEEYYNNFWFRTKKPYTSPLVGITMGVYGPWVQDLGHGGRPEIHPCEVIWWRNGSFDAIGLHPHVRWTIVVLQDDSNRFDRYANYDGVPLRPWSQFPRRAHITMSLQAPRGAHSLYNISIPDGLRVFEHPGEETLSVTRDQGHSALTVSKRMSQPAQVKVRLSELSPDPSNTNKLRCFLDIDVQVGEGDRGKEGFAELSIEHFVPVPNASRWLVPVLNVMMR